MISSAKILTVSELKNYREQDSQNRFFALVFASIEMHVTLLIHVVYADIKPMYTLCRTVSTICQRTAEQQPLHMSGFLLIIYAILNASVILSRTRNISRETRREVVALRGTVPSILNIAFQQVNTFSLNCL